MKFKVRKVSYDYGRIFKWEVLDEDNEMWKAFFTEREAQDYKVKLENETAP